MIDRIKGRLLHKSLTGIVVEVGGIGLAVAVPLPTFEWLPALGEIAQLTTYLNVRDDALELYGFRGTAEREQFISLMKVSGIGPKLAMAILSRFEPRELSQVIADGDTKRLTTVSGVGKKTAERIMIELRDRIAAPAMDWSVADGLEPSVTSEAIRALEVLGVPLKKADDAIRRAAKQLGEDASVEELVKQALKG